MGGSDHFSESAFSTVVWWKWSLLLVRRILFRTLLTKEMFVTDIICNLSVHYCFERFRDDASYLIPPFKEENLIKMLLQDQHLRWGCSINWWSSVICLFSHSYSMFIGLSVILAVMEGNMLLEQQGEVFTFMPKTAVRNQVNHREQRCSNHGEILLINLF